jgi:hypothetical protein
MQRRIGYPGMCNVLLNSADNCTMTRLNRNFTLVLFTLLTEYIEKYKQDTDRLFTIDHFGRGDCLFGLQ